MPIVSLGFYIKITLTGHYAGQETKNVFYYGSNTFAGTPVQILTDFWAQMLGPISNTMVSGTTFDLLELEEIGGGGAFGQLAIADSGNVSGDGLPPFVSWDFTLVRGGAQERNGYKRFAGVAESKQQLGTAINAFLAQLNVLAVAMFTPFTSTLVDWAPVIRRSYVNHVHQGPRVFYNVSNVVYSKIGSQNSRKLGHGR